MFTPTFELKNFHWLKKTNILEKNSEFYKVGKGVNTERFCKIEYNVGNLNR